MREILDWIARAGLSNIVWATDLDNTVIDHDRNTGETFVPAGLEEACRRLDQMTAGFYIVTGRSLNTVDNGIFPNARFRVSAEYHNMARFDQEAEPRRMTPEPSWDIIDRQAAALRDMHPDINLKVMPYMRAFQYFRVPENEREAVREALRAPLAELVTEMNAVPGAPRMEVVDFDNSFDIVPAGTSKGPAIDDIMSHAQGRSGHALVPIYFGDNPGDIPAGCAAQAHGGIFVCVGDDPEVLAAADFALKDTAAARALFTKVAGMDKAPAFQPPALQL